MNTLPRTAFRMETFNLGMRHQSRRIFFPRLYIDHTVLNLVQTSGRLSPDILRLQGSLASGAVAAIYNHVKRLHSTWV